MGRLHHRVLRIQDGKLVEPEQGSPRAGGETDPCEKYVEQVLNLALNEGQTLEKVKLEQSYAGPPETPAIRTMRQSQYLVLLTMEKSMKRNPK
ncbi:hypothetical protein CBR_g3109 [Chara braunii]|uniref:Uncharacterized protein n=1 Tax=Chara braunii TaxID=69332 RepID=A0A388KET4_CHABU|nr:hypothetical protein CBR_g3109 [Chara braunii]|eukprot:GBG68564.1 hypothetical protein CBR_g3109 [Chara braunii]